MFKKSVLAITLIAFAAPLVATASFAGPGSDQLAAQAGVEPGRYSDAQLAELLNARTRNDTTTVAFILAQGNGVQSRNDISGIGAPSAGAAQWAATLGVAPGAYSDNELVRLQNAIEAKDTQTIAFILGGSRDNGASSDLGQVTPGKAQLAATLGLDPADHTSMDLAAMYLKMPGNS